MSEAAQEYPKKYNALETENKWRESWDKKDLYKWDRDNASRENIFVVDTPPPTVSGSLHVGHGYSYAQTDMLVRFHRMYGKNIFYPMGWDDNGLPTERRAQNFFNIKCDPKVPYKKGWKPEKGGKTKDLETVSRQNFIEACNLITQEDEQAFEDVWKRLGLSVDWSLLYTTIGDHSRRISQLSFLDLVEKKLCVNTESVTMWDVDFQTAVAQAEVEDKEISGAYHDLVFGIEGGDEIIISTTRPELLAACIAVAAHPKDERYKKYFGKKAITPLFMIPVPIVPSEHADPEKGSGILMICTFGDVADVEWWKTSGLPIKQLIGRDGKLVDITFGHGPFESADPVRAQKAYDQIKGLRIKDAQKKTIELLKEQGSSVDGRSTGIKGEAKPITHPVRFYERGDNPLEFVPTRQWFINILEHKDALIEQGKKVEWHPPYMLSRYIHWVEGLNQEWCISRQRYFGVPFPVWYRVLENGEPDFDNSIYANKKDLPVDPQIHIPAGFTEDQRGVPRGFVGDSDVMDTWATSSMTPQIESHWGIDEKRHKSLFPMDLRPQAHDIIRTWAFYTIVKAWMHENSIPWKHAAISGFILDPDRKKMSKSKGNTLTPIDLLNEHSSDVFRYWAARGRLGMDSAFDDTSFKMGKKLVIKIFNAAKFVLMQIDGAAGDIGSYSTDDINEEFDRAWIAILKEAITRATKAFEDYDYTTALQVTEDMFWNFCDNYLEMVKVVAYQGGKSDRRKSAIASLDWTLKTFLRLFAPFMPFITEEIWSWKYSNISDSIHKAQWPQVSEIEKVKSPSNENSYKTAIGILSRINAAKTENKKALRTPVNELIIIGPEEIKKAIEPVQIYIAEAGNTTSSFIFEDKPVPEGLSFDVKVTLSEE